MRHMAASKKFFHAELDVSFYGYGGGHGDHCAGFDLDGTAHGELDCDDCVGVAVGDAVAAAVEGSDVVDCGGCALELAGWRGAAGEGGLAVEGGLAGTCQRSDLGFGLLLGFGGGAGVVWEGFFV